MIKRGLKPPGPLNFMALTMTMWMRVVGKVCRRKLIISAFSAEDDSNKLAGPFGSERRKKKKKMDSAPLLGRGWVSNFFSLRNSGEKV